MSAIPSTGKKSYYDILDISKSATKEDIRKAYRKLSLKWHPDRHQSASDKMTAEEKFKKISEAYTVLSDEEQRRKYDFTELNPNPFSMFAGGEGGGFPGGFGGLFGMPMNAGFMGNPHVVNVEGEQVDELLRSLFNNIGVPGHPKTENNGGNFSNIRNMASMATNIFNKPAPIIKTIEIGLKEAYNGTAYPLKIKRWVMQQNTKVNEEATVYVNIPPGIDDNEIVKCAGEGNVLSEHNKGDIKVFVKIKQDSDSLFVRRGLDLYYIKTISLKESLTGFKFDFDHLNGQNYVINNKNTIIPPAFKKVIEKMGMKRDDSQGNLIIEFMVEFPKKLSEEAKTAIKEHF